MVNLFIATKFNFLFYNSVMPDYQVPAAPGRILPLTAASLLFKFLVCYWEDPRVHSPFGGYPNNMSAGLICECFGNSVSCVLFMGCSSPRGPSGLWKYRIENREYSIDNTSYCIISVLKDTFLPRSSCSHKCAHAQWISEVPLCNP